MFNEYLPEYFVPTTITNLWLMDKLFTIDYGDENYARCKKMFQTTF